jgi:putative ABC transport system permease protein
LKGVSEGMLAQIASRSRGTGADILVRPPGSAVLGFSGNMSQKITSVVKMQPHVTLATGVLVQPIGTFDSIQGINLDEFNEISGGLKFLSGGPFSAATDLIIDEVYARTKKLKVGDTTADLGLKWKVCGIVEQGKLSRMFAAIDSLQDIYGEKGKISVVYVKLDDPNNTAPVVNALKATLVDYKIFSIDEMTSLMSVDSVPLLKEFTGVVIGLGSVIGFFAVLLSMYMAVLERTREIGILKAMGASPGYIMGILLREAVMLAIAGTILGILLTYGSRSALAFFAPGWTTAIVVSWWPRAAVIALVAALAGAIIPGWKAARLDPIEALAYD